MADGSMEHEWKDAQGAGIFSTSIFSKVRSVESAAFDLRVRLS